MEHDSTLGRALGQYERPEHVPFTGFGPVPEQIDWISSGTLCTLTGINQYDKLELIWRAWRKWAEHNSIPGEPWHENWARYQKGQ